MEYIDIEVSGKLTPVPPCIQRKSKDMRRVNQYRFYNLAAKVHPLLSVQDSNKIKDVFFLLFNAHQALVEAHKEHPLRVSKPDIQALIQAIGAIVPRDNNGNTTPESFQLLSDETTEVNYSRGFALRAAVTRFENVLSAELQSLDTYFISQKGTHSTPDLIDHAENAFPEDIREDLPAQAIKDIRAAGRCLALDTPTAAGFHILRAIEAVMAEYYHLVVDKPIPTRMRNWGIYIRKLNKSPKVDKRVTTFLDHIRENYRNPITHPEVILTSNEVEVLLGVATSAIRQMILAIQRLLEDQAKGRAVLERIIAQGQVNGADPAGASDSPSSAVAETQTPSESPSQTS